MALPGERNFQEIINLLEDLHVEWSESLDDLKRRNEQIINEDLFQTLDYLTACDQVCKAIITNIQTIDAELKNLQKLRENTRESKAGFNMFESMLADLKNLRKNMQNKMLKLNEEYDALAESTLTGTQDLITRYSEIITHEKIIPDIKTEIKQNLDKENLLEELKDSLEQYKQAREDLVEDPVNDPIISQLDTAITAVDSALIIKETQG